MVVARVEFQLGGEPPSGLVKSLKREKDEKVREVEGDVEATGLSRPGSIIVPYVHKLVWDCRKTYFTQGEVTYRRYRN